MNLSAANRPSSARRDHFVRFYEEVPALCREVARYLRDGVESGGAAMMIAEPAHRDGIMAEWAAEGFDPRAAIDEGQLVILDAEQTLAEFVVEGWTDRARFDVVVGDRVRGLLRRFGELVAFGEMVALLWGANRREAAIDLENAWNSLAVQHRFGLFCAYPMHLCADSDATEAFGRVCDAHTHVLPAEGLFTNESGGERLQLRKLAELQQKAASLASELEKRRRSEALLAERERQYADFLDNAVVGLHRVGADGRILWANRAELQLLGYSADEYIGRHIRDFHADKALIAHILDVLGSGGSLHDQPARLICKDGSTRHVLIDSNALMEDGKFVATRCFTRDVTGRWLAQEALRERTAVLHLALQAARMGYWVGDLASRRMHCSAELSELLGLAAAELDFESFVAMIHAEDRSAFKEAYATALAEHGMLSCEFRLAPGGQLRWFEARGEAIYDAADRATRFYGVCGMLPERSRREQRVDRTLAA